MEHKIVREGEPTGTICNGCTELFHRDLIRRNILGNEIMVVHTPLCNQGRILKKIAEGSFIIPTTGFCEMFKPNTTVEKTP